MIEKKSAVIDIESNGLLEDMLDYSSFPYKLKETARLWCVVVRDIDTGEDWYAENDNITPEWLKSVLEPFYYIIAHNGIKFDFPVLKLFKVLNYKIGYLEESDTCFGKEVVFLDSLILSRLGNPDRGGHSLAAWGKRTKEGKDDYRQQCIEAGYIEKNSPNGAQFLEWNPLMLPYCKQDCKSNAAAFKMISNEFRHHNWGESIKMEHKLADLAVSREHLGFDFDKELAEKCIVDLDEKLKNIAQKVEPLLPPKPLNQTELNYWTPPKIQIKKDGCLSSHMVNFLERIGATCKDNGFVFDGDFYPIPYYSPLKETVPAEMKDYDHIKSYLIELGWDPTEWSERDITKDSKKKILSYEKRLSVLDRWWKDTLNGKYTKHRLEATEIEVRNENDLDTIYETLKEKLRDKWPVRVYTAPKIRVGIEKEICPNLIKLGDKVGFAKDFADWLTYNHRRNSIAGGEDEEGEPTSGFLSACREVDGRIPTPAIEIGAATNRYVHRGVANIPRPSSMYGKEMRQLFGCGEGAFQLGFDFNSLENRIQGSFVYRYKGGKELAEALVAEKPNDLHSLNAIKLGISRTDSKSVTYALLYGASFKKIAKMLNIPQNEAKIICDNFWDSVPALKSLRAGLEKHWLENDKKFIRGIDGRKIMVRSKHSLLNFLFQSSGIIFAKYTAVLLMQKLEKLGYCINAFDGRPDVAEMISYHDEMQLFVDQSLMQFKTFDIKEVAEEFVKNWDGEQLSAIGDDKMVYVCLPNKVSSSITQAVRDATKRLKINVPMGIEWMVHKNWYGCH